MKEMKEMINMRKRERERERERERRCTMPEQCNTAHGTRVKAQDFQLCRNCRCSLKAPSDYESQELASHFVRIPTAMANKD